MIDRVIAAQAARAAPRLPLPQPATDMLLDGLALRFTEGYVAEAPSLKRALSALRDEEVHCEQTRWLSLALRGAADLFDKETWRELATRQVQTAHDTGALSVLPLVLVDTTDSLTTQEQQVAGLARTGHSNQEIGVQLFISPKTVEYHLHKAFNKLGIRSRHQLDRALRRD